MSLLETLMSLIDSVSLQALHGKQGKKWGSKKERDDSLKAEIKQLQGTLQRQQESQAALQAEVAQLSSACMDRSQEIGNTKAAIKEREYSQARAERQAYVTCAMASLP